jgi:hypothetical protein
MCWLLVACSKVAPRILLLASAVALSQGWVCETPERSPVGLARSCNFSRLAIVSTMHRRSNPTVWLLRLRGGDPGSSDCSQIEGLPKRENSTRGITLRVRVRKPSQTQEVPC